MCRFGKLLREGSAVKWMLVRWGGVLVVKVVVLGNCR